MTPLHRWSVSLACTAIAVAVAFLWLEQPITFFSTCFLSQAPMFDTLTLLPEPLVPLSLLTLFVLGLWALAEVVLQQPHQVALMCSASLIVAEALKSQLKFVF